jgi:hypothetical protein
LVITSRGTEPSRRSSRTTGSEPSPCTFATESRSRKGSRGACGFIEQIQGSLLRYSRAHQIGHIPICNINNLGNKLSYLGSRLRRPLAQFWCPVFQSKRPLFVPPPWPSSGTRVMVSVILDNVAAGVPMKSCRRVTPPLKNPIFGLPLRTRRNWRVRRQRMVVGKKLVDATKLKIPQA